MKKYRTHLAYTIKKLNETGRSMVEMLGVLAIIGVLSIAGIYGYTLAMRQYRANEIAKTAAMLLVMAQAADHGSGDCLELSSNINLPQNPGGVSVDMAANPMTPSHNVNIYIKNMDPDSVTKLCDVLQSLSPIINLCGSSSEDAQCQ